jgi:hypothetical protein
MDKSLILMQGPTCAPPTIGNIYSYNLRKSTTYQLLTVELKKWEHVLDDKKLEGSPVSVHAFFRLCVELGIPAEVQIEVAAAEKSEGWSFFAVPDQV